MRKRWVQVEHTADLALRIYGNGLDELFVNAAHAMFSQIDPKGSERSIAPVERQVRVLGMDCASLLVNWLNELLYLHETHREVYSEFALQTLHCQVRRGAAKFEARYHLEGKAPSVAGRKGAEILGPPGAQDDTRQVAQCCDAPAQVPGHRLQVADGQEPCELSATIRGAPSSKVQQIIKAATFHGLGIQCGRQGCIATVVFDV